MNTVERMARAICEDSGQSWESALESYREICTGFALAALRAIGEPDNDMLEAMHNAMFVDEFDGTGLPMLGAGFEAAIDAAIQQAETEG